MRIGEPIGLLVAFAAAAVQRLGVGLHAHFNHNDLYHVGPVRVRCTFAGAAAVSSFARLTPLRDDRRLLDPRRRRFER
jgi:hypothetical protein